MKKLPMTWIFLSILMVGTQLFGQMSKGVSQSDYDRLGQMVKAAYGDSYHISSVLNPDSLYPSKFPALRGCLVFGAYSPNRLTSPFIGVSQGASIVWTCEREIESSLVPDIDQVLDAHNDGHAQIFVLCGGGVSSISYELWIYTWDGLNGTRVNPVNENRSKMGYMDAREGYDIVDTNGDGIYEVRVFNLEDQTLFFQWDGSAYHQVTAEPTLPLPRDRLSVDVRVTVRRAGEVLRYAYTLFNRSSSLQSADDFLLEPTAGLRIAAIGGRANWKPASGPSFVRWTNLILFGDENFIRPGELDSNFSIQREGVPRIGRYYVQGHNGDEFSGSGILINSASGFTVAPSDSVIPFVTLDFLDTLTGYTIQSRTIGWVKDQQTSDKYIGYFNSIKNNLQQNNVGSARAVLQQVLRDVDIDSSSALTSEAYALIRYNSEYLMGQLPSVPPPLPGVNVKLINSTGSTLTGGSLQYYDGSWKDATNNNDGTFSVTTTLKTLSLRMTYEGGSQTKSNVTVGPDTVVFQTANVQVKLQSSQGAMIDTGAVQYYASAWRSFGTTASGIVSKELLPGSYSFRMIYAGGSNDKQQDIGSNPVVAFQTINASVQLKNSQGNPMDQGMVQYYAGSWRSFGVTTSGVVAKELLPNNYSFRMTYAYGSKDQQQNIGTNPVVVFQTVNAIVQLKNSQGALIDQGTVQYYAGAWRSFGTTSGGSVSMELLPINYSFRMMNEGVSNDKAQDLSANSTVNFATVLCTVSVKNSQNQSVDNAVVSYYATSWRQIGPTVNGQITKELLPANLTFRMAIGGATQDKAQNIGTNALVQFAVQ